jgi:hypothetical protein
MSIETSGLSSSRPGGLPLTSVDALSAPTPRDDAKTPAAPAAGALEKRGTVPEALFGASAPRQPPAATTLSQHAKDLGAPIAVSVSSTTVVGAGVLSQVEGRAAIEDGRTTYAASVRLRGRDFSQPGSASTLDERLTLGVTHRAIDRPKLKVDVGADAYAQLNHPLDGSDSSVQLGLRPKVGVSYVPTDDVTLAVNVYADLSRTLPHGPDAIVVGGDISAAVKLDDGFKLSAGARGETPNLLDRGGTPRVALFAGVSKQINDDLSASVEVIGGLVGTPTVSTSFAGAGDVAVKASLNWRL